MADTPFDHRRFGDAFSYEHDGLAYRANFNRFDNGELGEVFLDAGKVGSTTYQIAKELAVMFSIARRCGASLKVIRDALPKNANGGPAGPLGTALKLVGKPDAEDIESANLARERYRDISSKLKPKPGEMYSL